jgi:hypothetical protein
MPKQRPLQAILSPAIRQGSTEIGGFGAHAMLVYGVRCPARMLLARICPPPLCLESTSLSAVSDLSLLLLCCQ